ncbi:MAG: alpha/beta fold hydrolase [Nevskiales bacterium]
MRRVLLVLAILPALLLGGFVAFDRLFPEAAANLYIGMQRSRADLEPKSVAIPGFEIAYLEGGSGETLVLIHGSGADKGNWIPIARHLTPHYRVIALDLPGYGDSSKPDAARYRIAEQLIRLDQFFDALKLDSVHLGGNSMGGFIAGAYAGTHRQRVKSLWLLAPGGLRTAKESEVRRIYRETGRSPLFPEKPEDFDRVLEFVFAKPPFIPHGIKTVLAARAVRNFQLHSRIYSEIASDDLRLEYLLPSVTAPTLVLWGDQDRVLDVSGAEIVQQLLPSAKVVILTGVGHVPMIEAPAASAKALLDFQAR